MTCTLVYYTRIPNRLPDQYYWQLMALLPAELQQKNLRYKQWRDRLLHLAGKMLLLEALQQFGFNSGCLQLLKYNKYNRPYIPGNIDFNISHSGNYVVCAIAQQVQLGIDVEEIKPIIFSDFEDVMTRCQWKEINQAPNPLKFFYSYWTIKESVIKADSRGLSIPLTDISISTNFATCERNTWWLHLLNIDSDYCVSLAVSKPCMRINILEKWIFSETCSI